MSKKDLVGLSPPWYTFHNYLKHSIGKDQHIDVLEMEEISDDDYLVSIEVKCRNKAIALATLLVPCKNFGNVDVHVKVLHCGRTVKPYCRPLGARSLVSIYEEALDTNYYFEFVECEEFWGSTVIYPVFKKEVIQFYNDDLSDLFENFNGVAAMVFAEVLELKIDDVSVRPSTAIK